MNIDRIIHPLKSFAELDDSDVAVFLGDRAHKSERRNLEFKSAFPERNGEYDIREICKYIVGFSNEEGGLLVCGVSESIRDREAAFPDYVVGLTQWPSTEDLNHWAEDRIYPLITSLSVRSFVLEGRNVAIVRVPAQVSKPYCYYESGLGAVWYFKRTATGVAELAPNQIREFYLTCLIEQVVLQAKELRADVGPNSAGAAIQSKLQAHQKLIKPRLDNIKDFGFLGVYSMPMQRVEIPYGSLEESLLKYRFVFPTVFPEEIRYSPEPERFQDCLSFGYFPRAVREDIKSTFRVTVYTDGLVALDSEANPLRDGGKTLHPYWLSYELQRHLQLSRAVLEAWDVETIRLVLEMDNIEDFTLGVSRAEANSFSGLRLWRYTGAHHPVEKDVSLPDVFRWDGNDRNTVMPVVKDIMGEVYRIFGSPRIAHRLWDEKGHLEYVKGSEASR
ncbi:MAG TPA: ATP-binding protein [Terriglobia bacterium]|nr:ATP-binding protein [Terriglobia bacterium]